MQFVGNLSHDTDERAFMGLFCLFLLFSRVWEGFKVKHCLQSNIGDEVIDVKVNSLKI